MLKNVTDITSKDKHTGLNTQDNIIGVDNLQSPDMMDVKVLFDGSLQKRLGSNTQNTVIIANSANAGFSPNNGALQTGAQAFWKLDEASGTRFDSIGGNNLTDNNSVGQSGGIKNQAALFVAANSQYLLINNTSPLATGDIDFSISTWFYLTSTSLTTQQTLVSKTDMPTPYGGVDSSTVLMLPCNGTNLSTAFTDNCVYPHIMSNSGGAIIDTTQSKFGGASGKFNGTNQYLVTPDSTDVEFGSGDFTIDCQVRFATTAGTQAFVSHFDTNVGDNRGFVFQKPQADQRLEFGFSTDGVNLIQISQNWDAVANQWYHLAVVRSSNIFRLYVDGSQLASVTTSSAIFNTPAQLAVGASDQAGGDYFNGWIDEVRISKGVARWTGPFTAPTIPYGGPTEREYWLFIDSNNIVTFNVSSSGYMWDKTVPASGFGEVTTSTWYNVVAWHDTGNVVGISVNLTTANSAYSSGLRSGSAPFVLGCMSNGVLNFLDSRLDETGFWKKVLSGQERTDLYNSGNGNTYQAAFTAAPWASFDFGASSVRWLTVSAGTGVYASSNLGVTWVNIATDRSATYQSFERSKNVLIATSDLYDVPLYWAGSVNTFMARVNSNAPLTKYAINFNGFLILLNSSARKRGFFYQDENTQLTGTWASSFDIPSTQDDEITASFVLRRYLYVSTRYFLYRISYVGGNPDFSYLKVKDWGFIQRTVKYVYVDGVGQIVAGLCWDGKMRFFDGTDDQIFSTDIEQDNRLCEFALDKISFSGSGPVISFAETDQNENVYKLCLAIGTNSSQTTHMLNYDGRGKSFYPYSRQHFNTMVMAESANQRFLMAFDRSGYCHMMDSGNLDGNTTAINEHFDSALIYDKSPAQMQKGHQTNLFFTNLTCGRIHYLDRKDFDNEYKAREYFIISGSDKKSQIHKVIDVPESYNVYQWRITSSAGTSTPWKLNRHEHFLKGLGIGKG